MRIRQRRVHIQPIVHPTQTTHHPSALCTSLSPNHYPHVYSVIVMVLQLYI